MSTPYQIMQSVKAVNYLTTLVSLTDLCVGVKTGDKERTAIGSIFLVYSMSMAEARHVYSDLITATLRRRSTLLRIDTYDTLRIRALFALTLSSALGLGILETVRGTAADKPDRAFLGFGLLMLTVFSLLPICRKSTPAESALRPTLTRLQTSHITRDATPSATLGTPDIGHQALSTLRAIRVRRAMEPRYVESSLPRLTEVSAEK